MKARSIRLKDCCAVHVLTALACASGLAQSLMAQQVPTRLEVRSDPAWPGIQVEAVGLGISGVTGDDGRVILAVPPGVVELRARTHLGETVNKIFTAARWTDQVTLSFPGLRSKSANLTIQTLAGATVSVSGRPPIDAPVDGKVRFDGLVPGTYVIDVRGEDGKSAQRRVAVASGTDTQIDIRPPAPALARAPSTAAPQSSEGAGVEPGLQISGPQPPGTGVLIIEAERPTAVWLGTMRLGWAKAGEPVAARLPTGEQVIRTQIDDDKPRQHRVAINEQELTRLMVDSGERSGIPLGSIGMGVGALALVGGFILTGRKRRSKRLVISPLSATVTDGVGQQFDDYRVTRYIARGGMSVVYEARDKEDRRVALKVMEQSLCAVPDLSQKFLREGRVLSTINRRYPTAPVVKVFEFGRAHGVVDGLPFIAMEYLSGLTLTDYLRKQRTIPQTSVLRIICDITRALAAAHNCGVYHRDVSPENVLVIGAEFDITEIRVIDFGVAKHEFTRSHTIDGSIFGKPAYMAPEQWRGEAVDGRTDLYSLGVLTYLLLSGTTPFNDDNPMALMRMHEIATVPPLPATIDRRLANIVMRLLQKRPGDRFQTADELLQELENAGQPAASIT